MLFHDNPPTIGVKRMNKNSADPQDAAAKSLVSGAHLVGSVPLSNNSEVFLTVSAAIGRHLRRISDGETGTRSRWNSWTAPSYEHTRGLELVEPPSGSYTPWRQAKIVIDPKDLVLAPLGFSDAAIESYGVFSSLKKSGKIPGHLRFQVCLPSPIAAMIILIEQNSRAAVEPAHVTRLTQEINEIVEAIPNQELAIQWDVCQDVGIWEGYYPAYFPDAKSGVIERLKARAESIPEEVEVGFHLCYGDFKHKHFLEPQDLGVATDIANALAASINRTINWIHMPVPIDRDDFEYFAPLGNLNVQSETEIYLGLIHYDDGVEGASRRIKAAQKVIKNFGAATECGFGRRAPETIAPLLDLHAAITRPVIY